MRIKSRVRGGFTFVETLLSVFAVACAGSILVSAMPVSTVSRTKAKYLNVASNFAQKQVELMKAQGYANLNKTKLDALDIIDSTTEVATNTYACNQVDNDVSGRVGDLLPSGTATVKIEQVDLELKRLTVNVAWSERGRSRSYVLSSLVANL
jgi:type II secretory pathway pseudopilin PulG